MRKISEVLRQRLDLKLPNREISQSLNISQSTVYDYISMAKLAGISWPLPALPDWELVHQEMHIKGVTLLLLWREYREVHSNGLGYNRFCHWYQQYVKNISCDEANP
jgi:transposase